jgi:hypothetical protein
MFFLGGINSILPYLLYLSLIWVFLIIGYGSRYVHGLKDLAPKTKYTDNQALQHFDNQVFQYYQYTNHVVEPKNVIVAYPSNVKYFLPLVLQNYSPGSCMLPVFTSCPVSSTGFRGPPIHKF